MLPMWMKPSMHTGNKFSDALKEAVKNENAEMIIMNNSIEAQIQEMENPEDQSIVYGRI